MDLWFQTMKIRSTSVATLYYKTKEDSGTLIVSIYVDDIVYTGSSGELIVEFKFEMMRSVAPRECKDLDELNFVVQQLRNEVAVLHHEKGELEERVLCLEKCANHVDVRNTGDAGEESHKTEDGGVVESSEDFVQNEKEKVQYAPPDINWDDPDVVCVTLVKFLTNPPQKIGMSTTEGDRDKDVIVGVQQKEHMIHIKTTYPKFRKRTKWLQDKHNSTFIQWLHFIIQS
ncbi:hypothetical protein L3X38_018329 [Prunus dulcis]|uniref:Reverse transcriptase Ty1/copia-type domain-containing protein n=1 Tax=Prunus dulcis TaxID=3755 RepID=A0AAD4WAT2_PRUDU|nr:hypothetical protein L3X38_018329 [Prunus dulcis]